MNTYKNRLITALTLIYSGSSYALDPAAIDFEGLEVTPAVEISGTYDDNYQAVNNGPDSWITAITPGVLVTAYGDKTLYQLKSGIKYELYSASNAKDLTSYFVTGTATFNFDVRNQLDIEIGLDKTESAANAFVANTINSFKQTNIGASYVYGAPSATGNIEFGVNHEIHRSGNGLNLDRERDSTAYRAAFLYKITDKTKLVAELNGSRHDYVTNTALDATNISYLLGARWEATAKTTGHAKFGSETKDFDDSSRANANLTKWEASVDWSPLTYSTVTLTTNQQIDEGSYGASYTDSANNGIQWKHDWGRGYASQVSLNNRTDDYNGIRKDTTNSIGAGITYNIRRWADIAFDFQHSDRTSTDSTQEYNRNIYKLTFNVGL
ncbi:outer membrane beta-barrel protein [Thiomicrorhabdus sp. Milos-T2]|uniref:outer membrane beta-barrel protein n=1 Tax=Thiomicrorhabdus sp. Milos-T2 TaxID=90814 RepID=UPI0004944A0C|nr:outer membrane beta-barrel protein [Thiomicrorhabdus sp. Milos-T2]